MARHGAPLLALVLLTATLGVASVEGAALMCTCPHVDAQSIGRAMVDFVLNMTAQLQANVAAMLNALLTLALNISATVSAVLLLVIDLLAHLLGAVHAAVLYEVEPFLDIPAAGIADASFRYASSIQAIVQATTDVLLTVLENIAQTEIAIAEPAELSAYLMTNAPNVLDALASGGPAAAAESAMDMASGLLPVGETVMDLTGSLDVVAAVSVAVALLLNATVMMVGTYQRALVDHVQAVVPAR